MSSSSYFPGRSRLEPEINASTKILRVSSVMTPNLFWATELPLQSMHFENTPMGKVLKLEFELRGLYTQDPSKTPIKLIPAGALDPKSLRPGKMVAVRRHHADPHWYRGRVLSVFQSGPNAPDVARIFLLDYGEYLEDVNLRMNVRKLPIKMTLHPKPLAVPLVLAGPSVRSTELIFQLTFY